MDANGNLMEQMAKPQTKVQRLSHVLMFGQTSLDKIKVQRGAFKLQQIGILLLSKVSSKEIRTYHGS